MKRSEPYLVDQYIRDKVHATARLIAIHFDRGTDDRLRKILMEHSVSIVRRISMSIDRMTMDSVVKAGEPDETEETTSRKRT